MAGEVDVAHEWALGHHERDLHAALEILDPHLDVVEEAQAEDGLDVLREEGGVEGGADRALDPAEDHGFLHAPVALDGGRPG